MLLEQGQGAFTWLERGPREILPLPITLFCYHLVVIDSCDSTETCREVDVSNKEHGELSTEISPEFLGFAFVGPGP